MHTKKKRQKVKKNPRRYLGVTVRDLARPARAVARVGDDGGDLLALRARRHHDARQRAGVGLRGHGLRLLVGKRGRAPPAALVVARHGQEGRRRTRLG